MKSWVNVWCLPRDSSIVSIRFFATVDCWSTIYGSVEHQQNGIDFFQYHVLALNTFRQNCIDYFKYHVLALNTFRQNGIDYFQYHVLCLNTFRRNCKDYFQYHVLALNIFRQNGIDYFQYHVPGFYLQPIRINRCGQPRSTSSSKLCQREVNKHLKQMYIVYL